MQLQVEQAQPAVLPPARLRSEHVATSQPKSRKQLNQKSQLIPRAMRLQTAGIQISSSIYDFAPVVLTVSYWLLVQPVVREKNNIFHVQKMHRFPLEVTVPRKKAPSGYGLVLSDSTATNRTIC